MKIIAILFGDLKISLYLCTVIRQKKCGVVCIIRQKKCANMQIIRQ